MLYLTSIDVYWCIYEVSYVKTSSPANLQHIHHFRDNSKHDCGTLIRAVREKTNRVFDVEIFIKTLLFDALIGNPDRHGRNIALLQTADRIILSPIYDNVSYLGLEHGAMLKADFNPTSKISTASSENPGMRDYVSEIYRLGYGDLAVEFYISLKKAFNKINLILEDSFCSDFMKEALLRLVEKRYKELENGIRR